MLRVGFTRSMLFVKPSKGLKPLEGLLVVFKDYKFL
jgi:hypothetical protein